MEEAVREETGRLDDLSPLGKVARLQNMLLLD